MARAERARVPLYTDEDFVERLVKIHKEELIICLSQSKGEEYEIIEDENGRVVFSPVRLSRNEGTNPLDSS